MTETQKQIADKCGISETYMSMVVNGKKRPGYMAAKKLAEVTGSDVLTWLEGSVEEKRKILNGGEVI